MSGMKGRELTYQALVARRLQWDNLLWQVPILSFTAQAFLFSVALGADTSRVGRLASSTLAVVIAFLSVTLMKSHRRAELTDAHWLRDLEREELDAPLHIHGEVFRERRSLTSSDAGLLDKWIPNVRGYRTWVLGLTSFGLMALFIIVVTIVDPAALEG